MRKRGTEGDKERDREARKEERIVLKSTLILFYKQPLFLAEPGRAYENPKFEPQACLGPCLVNYKCYTYT